MRYTFISGILFIWVLNSCSRIPVNYISPRTSGNGKIEIYSSPDKFALLYFGDYTFLKYSPKNSPHFNRDWNKTMRIQRKAELCYSAHTTIQPYCSVLGIRYASESKETITALIYEALKQSGKAENILKETKQLGREFFQVIEYDFFNSKYSRNVHYTEYVFQQGNHVHRIAFSTEETNLDWFKNECKGILESLEYR